MIGGVEAQHDTTSEGADRFLDQMIQEEIGGDESVLKSDLDAVLLDRQPLVNHVVTH